MSSDITFIADCQICPRKNVPCRQHHFVPQRLLKKLPFGLAKRWEFQKVIICNSCNGYFHPENHLYEEIEYLKNQITDLKAKLESKNEQSQS